MELAHHFLTKYRSLTPPQATKAKLIVRVIKDECGIELTHTDITIRRGGATLVCHPAVRSELMRYTPHILEVLQRDHNLRLAFLR